MYCKECGAKLDDDAVFCMNCGVKILDTQNKKICPNCGAAIVDDAFFCMKCGTKLDSTAEIETYNLTNSQKEKTVKSSKEEIDPGLIAFIKVIAVFIVIALILGFLAGT